MKKIIILLLTLSLLLAGCGSAAPETTEATTPETTVPETTVPETTEETQPETTAGTEPPAPDTVDFIVQADRTPAVLALLNRGDTVEVVGQLDEQYCVIRLEQGWGLIEKGLLRLEGEEGYEGWTGYAYYGAELKGSYQLTGEPLQTLTMNTRVEVLEELPNCYMVQLGDVIGFVAREGLSRSYIRSGGGSGGQDGGDISMGTMGGADLLSYTVPQEGQTTGSATVLCDGAQVLLGWFDREEIAQVITEEGYAPAWEGWHSVYLNGFCVHIPQGLLWDPAGESYARWEGYSAYSTEVYDNYLLLGEPVRTLTINTVATILWDTGDSLVISIDGGIFYANAADFSATRRSTGGGSSGGDWTPPAM